MSQSIFPFILTFYAVTEFTNIYCLIFFACVNCILTSGKQFHVKGTFRNNIKFLLLCCMLAFYVGDCDIEDVVYHSVGQWFNLIRHMSKCFWEPPIGAPSGSGQRDTFKTDVFCVFYTKVGIFILFVGCSEPFFLGLRFRCHKLQYTYKAFLCLLFCGC